MKKLIQKMLVCVLLVVATMSMFTGCSSDDDYVVIGSKGFTENILVAELYALALEDAGVPVKRELELATSGVHDAITSDEIDMYPEYTGTGLTTWLGEDAVYDPEECYEIVSEKYEEQFGITWLEPTGVNNTETMTVTKAFSEERGITKISELWEIMDELVLACNTEFYYQTGIYDRLQEVYGEANFKEELTMEHSLCLVALLEGDCDVVDAYGTEGVFASGEYYILEDDLQCWPPYYLAPIIQTEKLEQFPEVEALCNAVSATLDTESMIALNGKVDVDGEDLYEVAAEYYETIKTEVQASLLA